MLGLRAADLSPHRRDLVGEAVPIDVVLDPDDLPLRARWPVLAQRDLPGQVPLPLAAVVLVVHLAERGHRVIGFGHDGN